MPPRPRFDLSTGAEEREFHQETIGIITNQRGNSPTQATGRPLRQSLGNSPGFITDLVWKITAIIFVGRSLYVFSAKGAVSPEAWGSAPGSRKSKSSALKPRFTSAP